MTLSIIIISCDEDYFEYFFSPLFTDHLHSVTSSTVIIESIAGSKIRICDDSRMLK